MLEAHGRKKAEVAEFRAAMKVRLYVGEALQNG